MEARYASISSALARKLWSFVRVVFLMMRKGLITKRKLIMELNLMIKRGKLVRKSLTTNLLSLLHHHHHHHHHHRCRRVKGLRSRGGFNTQGNYEFSCSNSPNPVFSHLSTISKLCCNKHGRVLHHHYFPCINPPLVIEDLLDEGRDNSIGGDINALMLLPKTPEYTFNLHLDASCNDLEPRERTSPLLSPFSVKISDYLSEDEQSETGNTQIDDEAEEFIKRFYDQLRAQSRMQLLQY